MKNTKIDFLEEQSKIKTRLRTSDLVTPNNLKVVFLEIRDYLAGNAKGITRDEILTQQLMILLFCKIYDEKSKNDDDLVDFYALDGDEPHKIADLIISFYESKVKPAYKDIFDGEKIILDAISIRYTVNKLQRFNISRAERDVIGDAFEAFFGRSLRGSEGQFFTPKNVVRLMVDILNPASDEKILDPACGCGGFLIGALNKIHEKLRRDYKDKEFISKKFREVSSKNVFGVDKDAFLAKLTKAYISIVADGKGMVFCEDSLDQFEKWHIESRKAIKKGTFDLILTNPPFGAKIPVQGKEKLQQYKLGFKWIKSKKDEWQKTTSLLDSQPPQILFIERCLQLLKEGGRLAIVLPEGLFGNPSDRYIWEFLFKETKILAIISLAQEAFQPSTHTKTSVLFLEKKKVNSDYPVFMAIAEKIGHNKNGKEIYKMKSDGSYIKDKNGNFIVDDDIPTICESYMKKDNGEFSHTGFWVRSKDIKKEFILIPEYYNPDIEHEIKRLGKFKKYELFKIEDLISKGYISITRGNEIGSQFYGTGDVPFVRTSDIVNWEIKFDPIKCVTEEVYEQYRNNQDVRPNDILFVNDGTFLIGRVAMITEMDCKIIIQSHVKKIRVNPNPLFDCYFLFYLLNTDIIKKQIESKTFVQATLSTIGNRLREIILPIPLDEKVRQDISGEIKDIIQTKMELKKRSFGVFKLDC